MTPQLHGILFAYRDNPHLRELTTHRTVASIPFGGRFRMIDFMLSNMVNAGIDDIGVVMQEKCQSLLDHLGSGKDWDLARKRGGLRVLPPFNNSGTFRGKMEALQNVYSYVNEIRQDYVVMADGDVACNLDLQKVFDQHIATGADITAVCTPKYSGDPQVSTYFKADADGRVIDVLDGPHTAEGLESLKVYILSTKKLVELVDYCASHNLYSFTAAILLAKKDELKIQTYLFDGYVARLTSVASYYARSMELLHEEVGKDLFDLAHPIRTKDRSDPSTFYSPDAKVTNSLVADGCIIEGTVEDCVIFRGVHVAKDAVVRNCVLMQDTVVEEGANIRHVIADKNVTIKAHRTLAGHMSYPLAIDKLSII
ncbi:MAG: glucose-1-phosphate adenylyltransferase subunit GlgD [Oscillospiraceae bacterium]|nr:glucose-1-phosphate adenylyltransferase subunit GlgD [Oscillospiraceae bacterium]